MSIKQNVRDFYSTTCEATKIICNSTIENTKSYWFVLAGMMILSISSHGTSSGSIINAVAMWMVTAATLRLLHDMKLREAQKDHSDRMIEHRGKIMHHLIAQGVSIEDVMNIK